VRSLLLATIVFASVLACGKPNLLVGSWNCSPAQAGGGLEAIFAASAKVALTFGADGSFAMSVKSPFGSEVHTGSWSEEGGEISIHGDQADDEPLVVRELTQAALVLGPPGQEDEGFRCQRAAESSTS